MEKLWGFQPEKPVNPLKFEMEEAQMKFQNIPLLSCWIWIEMFNKRLGIS
jgi:hypothetical protein